MLGAVAVVGYPFLANTAQLEAAALVCIYAIVAISLLVLTGWAGHISLGQFALVGFGGATTAVLYGRHGWDIFLATLAGVLVASLVSLIIGLPALRIRGPFLAVTTLAFAVTSATYFLKGLYFPWFVENRIDRPALFERIPLEKPWQLYILCLVGLIGVAVGASALRKSHTGRVLVAVRDNETAAEASGINTTRMKLVAFVISGAMAGFAGALFVVHQKGFNTDSFNADASIVLFSMVVIGGLGSLPGVILGAVYIRGVQFFLPPEWALLASGAGILLLLMFLPEGLGGVLYTVRDRYLRWVARRRGILVPSLLADRRVEEAEEEQASVAIGTALGGLTAGSRDEPNEGECRMSPLLSVRDVDVAYDQTQVLFGVNIDIEAGEIVALLGTNGAGKSTLLKAISGLNPAKRGLITFDGRDISVLDPGEIAHAGIAQVPGGRGIFPSLTVTENLRIAGWLYRKDRAYSPTSNERVLGYFPRLAERADTVAGSLSGGEQQMLSLAQAFIAEAAFVDDRRVVAWAGAHDRRSAPRDRAHDSRERHDDHPRRTVRQRGVAPCQARDLHGEGRGSFHGADRRPAQTHRHSARGVL